MTRPTRTHVLGALVAAVTLLPFARGLLLGRSFYFRDLAGQFFPFRRFVIEGLARGEWRDWNPFCYEGAPLSLPPISYPLDLLQLLVPNEWGFSLLLALHVPLAALSFFMLARGLGLAPLSAAGGAIVYALGGFSLSTLNLYVYVQAMAWAPVTILALSRAGEGLRHALTAGALIAVLLTTLGAEIAAQAIGLGVVLALASRRSWSARTFGRIGLAGALSAGLALPVFAFIRGLMAGSERSAGFTVDVVLAHSIHPLTLAQVVVANFYGDLNDIVDSWWGQSFFPQGFPYFLSLYLGVLVLGLAAIGVGRRAFPRGPLLVASAFALWLSLGRFAGWETLAAHLPAVFRYPSKAFFTVHLVIALFAAAGLDHLREDRPRAWNALAIVLIVIGALLAVGPWLPRLAPRAALWFAAGFFPANWAWPLRFECLGRMLGDARAGGALALLGGIVAALAARSRLDARLSRGLLVGLVAADLLRAGAGLNAMVRPSFYQLSPEMTAAAAALRAREARVFTCALEESAAYHAARRQRGADHELWTFAVQAETFSPFANMDSVVASAYNVDRTMFVSRERVAPPERAGCADRPPDIDALRLAGVTDVVSLDPLTHDALALQQVLRPERITPLAVHLYALRDPLPRRAVAGRVNVGRSRGEAEALALDPEQARPDAVAVEGAAAVAVADAKGEILEARTRSGRIELRASADRPTVVVVREGYAAGWRAEVNGVAAPVWRANGRHLAVPIPQGESRVALRYVSPHARAAWTIAFASAVLLAVLWRRSAPDAGPRR